MGKSQKKKRSSNQQGEKHESTFFSKSFDQDIASSEYKMNQDREVEREVLKNMKELSNKEIEDIRDTWTIKIKEAGDILLDARKKAQASDADTINSYFPNDLCTSDKEDDDIKEEIKEMIDYFNPSGKDDESITKIINCQAKHIKNVENRLVSLRAEILDSRYKNIKIERDLLKACSDLECERKAHSIVDLEMTFLKSELTRSEAIIGDYRIKMKKEKLENEKLIQASEIYKTKIDGFSETLSIYNQKLRELSGYAKELEESSKQERLKTDEYKTIAESYSESLEHYKSVSKFTEESMKRYKKETKRLEKELRIMKHEMESIKFSKSLQLLSSINKGKEVEDSPLNGFESECLMCMDKKPSITFFPCMHMGTCNSCSKLCGSSCPICNEIIQARISSFLV